VPRNEWVSDDPRDVPFDRSYHVLGFDALADLRAGHHAIVVALAIPGGRLERAVLIDRLHTNDLRRDARDVCEMLTGHDGSDRDRARNLRNRVDVAKREVGQVELALGVFYGPRLAVERKRELPTPAMLQQVATDVANQTGYAGYLWTMASTLDELPLPPHARMQLAVVGIDARGRIDGSLPRPSVDQVDRWFKRDLRALAKAVVSHALFSETVKTATRKGQQVVFLWRPERGARQVA